MLEQMLKEAPQGLAGNQCAGTSPLLQLAA